MKQTLQLRVSQHLALTPQLQQSIRLLQLSTLELHQELEQMLTDNPLLERLDDPLDNSIRLLGDGAISQAPTTPSTESEPSGDASAASEGTFDAPAQGEEGGGAEAEWSFDDVARSSKAPEDDDARPQIEAHESTLREHLLEQLSVTVDNRRDRALVELLIEALDDNGYLEEPLEDIHGRLPEELDIDMDEMQVALKLLQSFDPAGVGARNASECLSLQIRRMEKVPFVTRRMALTLVENYLELFAQREFNKLKKALDCDDEDLREAQVVIKACNPHPGAPYAGDASDYVVPDVIVKRAKNGWQVTLNRDLIKNMRQRFDTILRVAQAIVERQRNFFSHGEVAMKPLVLREIADTLGLHESTISRVTTQKYMLTPHGMFELKYFFGSHVATEAGGEASSTAIRALIKQLIGAEDTKNPFSDSKITDMLAEQGMVVARRTVAKYREALKIPPVNLRKSL
jgi:RNA polymerase sigma-54 factor